MCCHFPKNNRRAMLWVCRRIWSLQLSALKPLRLGSHRRVCPEGSLIRLSECSYNWWFTCLSPPLDCWFLQVKPLSNSSQYCHQGMATATRAWQQTGIRKCSWNLTTLQNLRRNTHPSGSGCLSPAPPPEPVSVLLNPFPGTCSWVLERQRQILQGWTLPFARRLCPGACISHPEKRVLWVNPQATSGGKGSRTRGGEAWSSLWPLRSKERCLLWRELHPYLIQNSCHISSVVLALCQRGWNDP